MKLEVCIDSVESALAAEAGGAHRLELCDNLVEGGTTPSWGMVEVVSRRSQLPVMVMIRPRGGDFLYTDAEMEVMKEDIRIARDMDIAGIVLGLLQADGNIDQKRTGELVSLAGSLQITFHRAFDMTPDPVRALEDLMALGIHRVLTSGQEADAFQGRGLIRELVQRAGGRISIMPGGGIHENNIRQLVEETGVEECHVSARHTIPSEMQFTNPRVYMGTPGLPEYERKVTSTDRVHHIIQAVENQEL